MGTIKSDRRWPLISKIMRKCPSGNPTVTAMFHMLLSSDVFSSDVLEPMLKELLRSDTKLFDSKSLWSQLQIEFDLWSKQQTALVDSAREAIHALEFKQQLPDYLTLSSQISKGFNEGNRGKVSDPPLS